MNAVRGQLSWALPTSLAAGAADLTAARHCSPASAMASKGVSSGGPRQGSHRPGTPCSYPYRQALSRAGFRAKVTQKAPA